MTEHGDAGGRDVATGARAIRWDFCPDNPVIKPGQLHGELDAESTNCPSVIQLGDMYRLFYRGSGKGKDYIFMAEAPIERPNDWRGMGVVVGPEAGDPTRVQGARWPWAVAIDEKTIFLYYLSRGVQTAAELFPNVPRMMISEDAGATWREPSPEPFIGMDKPYDQETIGSFSIVRMGAKFHLYYTASGGYRQRPETEDVYGRGPLAQIGIGLAISDDGLTWEKPYDHFLIPPRLFATDPYETKVAVPRVIPDGDVWRMWVSCLAKHYRICSLVSRDGVHWHWQPAGIDGDFGLGVPGAFDDQARCHSMVLKHSDGYRCWYVGNNHGATGIGYARGALG